MATTGIINMLNYASQSVRADFKAWFDRLPDIDAASWNVISDYCVNDSSKRSDVFSFAVLLNHGTPEEIAGYIGAVAPRDIKHSRGAYQGLLDYLACPVSFSLNFVVERRTSFLKSILTLEAMQSLTADLRGVVNAWTIEEPPNSGYYGAIDRRLRSLADELGRKRSSLRLLRQIFLVASFAAIVFSVVNDAKAPITIKWISDRDAMFDRHDGIAFDLGWILFQMMRRMGAGLIDLRRPQIAFASPGMDGVTEYAELMRMPDILAGTLADMRLPQVMFSHKKFPPVFNRLFAESPNNAVVEIVDENDIVKARRIGFGAPPIGPLTPGPYSKPSSLIMP